MHEGKEIPECFRRQRRQQQPLSMVATTRRQPANLRHNQRHRNGPHHQDPLEALAGGAQGTSGHHHHHGGGFAKKIESAVTTALEIAPAGSDPNQIIKDAIAQGGRSRPTRHRRRWHCRWPEFPHGQLLRLGGTTLDTLGSANGNTLFSQLLQSDGVTSQQFQQDFQAALAANPSPVSDSTNVSGSAANSDAAFNQLLQSNGISPQQFQQDLQDALATSQSRQLQLRLPLQKLPPRFLASDHRLIGALEFTALGPAQYPACVPPACVAPPTCSSMGLWLVVDIQRL